MLYFHVRPTESLTNATTMALETENSPQRKPLPQILGISKFTMQPPSLFLASQPTVLYTRRFGRSQKAEEIPEAGLTPDMDVLEGRSAYCTHTPRSGGNGERRMWLTRYGSNSRSRVRRSMNSVNLLTPRSSTNPTFCQYPTMPGTRTGNFKVACISRT